MSGVFWHKRKGTSLWQVQTGKLRYSGKGKQFIAPSSSLHNFLRSDEWQHVHMSSMFVLQQHEAARKQQHFAPASDIKHAFVHYSSAVGNTAPRSKTGRYSKLWNDNEREIEALLLWNNCSRLLFDCRSLRNDLFALRSSVQLEQAASFCLTESQRLAQLGISPFATDELQQLLARHKTRQFIGTQRHYDFLRQYHDFQFSTRNYWIMLRRPSDLGTLRGQIAAEQRGSIASANREQNWTNLPSNLRIERLKLAHFSQLLPLEQAYYAEEVVLRALGPSLERALEKQCYERLKQYLQYGVFAGKKLLSRAMVNSYGLYYWQIGGIYTVPDWRSHGLAELLLQRLCQSIEEAGRIAMLFVRQENPIAINLYKKNGFKIFEQMVIAQENIS